MKRYGAIILSLMLGAATLTACGSKKEEATTAPPTATVEESASAQEETKIEEEEEDTAEPESDMEDVTTTPTPTPTEDVDADELDTDNEDTGTIKAGSNMNDAVLLPQNTKVALEIEEDQYVWVAFATGGNEDDTYNVTTVNTTPDSNYIVVDLYDEYGTSLGRKLVDDSGTPGTICADELEANTTYYLQLSASNYLKKTGCTIIVKNPAEVNTAYKTVGNLAESGGTANALSEDGKVVAGTNQSYATMLPLDTRAFGTFSDPGYAWFSFTTEENEEATYNITSVNMTPDSTYIVVNLYDEYGTSLGHDTVDDSGAPVTISADDLEPNTTYYVSISTSSYDKKIEYSLTIKSPEEKVEESTLVFEVPFEINETQVQFVINKAEFIDEAKAKEVLKPVAEAINNAPDHSILIAGTTATDGTQESCVQLALKRAEAVKNLLINTYGVSEAQIQVVGLGYEADPFERGQDIDGNGNFVESEAKKNRRVVILDVDDPIAQQLLSNQ